MTIWGNQAIVASGIPLAPTAPASYFSWLLQYQQPLGGPGVVLTPTFHWQFDSLTDLVAAETLAVAGTVPLTDLNATPESSSNLQSPLVTGYATFDGTTDALTAATSGVQDITSSALIVWCARFPDSLASTAVVSKRETLAPNTGYENIIDVNGKTITTLDYGASAVILALNNNVVAEQTGGTWHWFALLVDSPTVGTQQAMFASDEEITPWFAIPGGSLSTSTLLSFGAGRLQAQNMDLLAQIAVMGSSVEGIFNSPTEAASASNTPSGPNIRDNVCKVLALDTVQFVATDPGV